MKSPTILIVDDDASFRRVLEYQLNEAGYNTSVAAYAIKALGFFSDKPHDLVFTDLDMPELAGNELLEQVKQ